MIENVNFQYILLQMKKSYCLDSTCEKLGIDRPALTKLSNAGRTYAPRWEMGVKIYNLGKQSLSEEDWQKCIIKQE